RGTGSERACGRPGSVSGGLRSRKGAILMNPWARRSGNGCCLIAGRSLNHPIRPEQYRLRDLQPECLRSPLVDDQLELRRLLNGQLGRLHPFQDLVDVGCRATEVGTQVDAVAHETTSLRVFPLVHGRQTTLCGKALKPFSVKRKHRVRQYEEGLCALSD